MIRFKLTFVLVLGLGILSFAQSDVDVLRYSTFDPLGSTARSMGMGGAIGALGADPSVQLSNPAGLAQFRSGMFGFGFDMRLNTSRSTYIDNDYSSNIGKVTIPNLNIVFSNVKTYRGNPVTEGWVNFNFAMGMNRTADFTKKISYSGVNTSNSMLNYMASYVQGLPASALDANDEQLDYGFYYFENMFWYAYLIDTVQDGQYYPYYDQVNANQQQSGTITSRGGMNEFNFSFAANYEHKVFVGFGMNIHSLNYSETNLFSETDNPNTTENWSSFDFTRHLNTEGYGVSGRLGLMFKPNDNLRLGLNLTTPTFFRLTDSYYDELYVRYDLGGSEDLSTIDKTFDYEITTPVRYGIQAGYVVGKRGIISAEIEQINYATMGISSDSYGFEPENQRIANKYQSATNVKVGGELAFDALRLRAGYARMGNPFRNRTNLEQQFLTAGFGIHEKAMSFDVAVVKQFGEEEYYPYTVYDVSSPVVTSSLNNTRIALTMAFKF